LKRDFTSYAIADFEKFKSQLLNFGKEFSNFCFLDNHEYGFDKSYECLAAIGSIRSITAGNDTHLEQLKGFQDTNKDWIFGHVSYDLKNEIEELVSQNPDAIQFPDFHFFVPEAVIILSKEKVEISSFAAESTDAIYRAVSSTDFTYASSKKLQFQSRFSRDEYLQTVKMLQAHIAKGDCYEICFCQEFFAENAEIDPVNVFRKLGEISPNPFSAFYKYGDKYLMCASPERFLKKTDSTIISQPIKGTSKRSAQKDDTEKSALQKDEKERAENIMIVDLVRNDLSKICAEGSVAVKEFLKIYSFPQVHQMISTISGELKEDTSFADIFRATFPMGSMTGAPKKRVMELIEQYEKTKRGLFSGSVGYIDPEGNFDFNVVIRSILYNRENKYVSIHAGSAITFKSVPENEYEECNLKIEAMKEALE
jgi:para-aminobenzoate synthetase component 1